MFWYIRYRGNFTIELCMVKAHSHEMAEKVGRAWCEKESIEGRPKIFVVVVGPAVVADETILTPPEVKAEASRLNEIGDVLEAVRQKRLKREGRLSTAGDQGSAGAHNPGESGSSPEPATTPL